MTSRLQDLDVLDIRHPIHLQAMEPQDAVDFLFRRTEHDGGDSQVVATAGDLARELGYLPLALEQAAAYILKVGASFDHYCASFKTRRLKLLEKQRPVVGDYEGTVATTWAINFDEVNANPASADALYISAYFAPDDIPEQIFVNAFSHMGENIGSHLKDVANDPLLMDELLSPLAKYSLITRNATGRTFTIHRLVQDVVKSRLEESGQAEVWSSRAVASLSQALPIPEFDNWSVCQALLPHALAGITLIGDPPAKSMHTREAGLLLDNTGRYLSARARYDEAGDLFRRAISIRDHVLGQDNPETAMSVHNMAWILVTQGRYTEAETYLLRAADIRERILGPDHLDTAKSLGNLGSSLQGQGRYAEAESLCVRALDIRERIQGPDHPDTAVSLTNLADVYQGQGRYAEAEPLCVRALDIRERIQGPDHPNTAVSLHSLAILYSRQKKWGQSAAMAKRAMNILLKTLPKDHPHTASTMESYALALHRMNLKRDAVTYMNRAASMKKRHANS